VTAMAQADKRVVAITAAMPAGTGLTSFAHVFPERFFDVGIAEQHAVTFAAGLACQGFTVEAMHPHEAILDHAKNQGCDLIVMASHGRRGVAGVLLGSETQKVLTHSNIPVLVLR